jgi:ribosome-associated heat shock protein Hsp15
MITERPESDGKVRLDKWLHAARAFKTRTQATTACEHGRVAVNGTTAKPHRALRLGDRVEIESGDWTRVLVVQELRDRPLPKAEAARLADDQSPPRPVPDPLAKLQRQPPLRRDPGAGRPTKRDRRDLERVRDGKR